LAAYSIDFCWTWKNRDSNEDPSNEFELKLIGKGAFGKCYKATHKATEFVLCIKILIGELESNKSIRKEIGILKKCRHANIVSYYGTCEWHGNTWILMEYCGSGSLQQILTHIFNQSKTGFSEPVVVYFLKSILEGLSYLHDTGVIHRDIKPENILITLQGDVKIADFGASADIDFKTLESSIEKGSLIWETVAGSMAFMSPEVLDPDASYGHRADIWSLGMTSIFLADGKHLFSGYSLVQMVAKLSGTGYVGSVADKTKWSKDFLEFIDLCLQRDYSKRPTAAQLLQTNFMKPPVAELKPKFVTVLEEYLKAVEAQKKD